MNGLRVGIDLGGTKIEGVLLGEGGGILRRERIPTPRNDYDGTVEAVCQLVRRLSGGDGLPTVGVGTPGVWMPDRQVMKNCNSSWLNGRALKTDIEYRLGAGIGFANDADCFVLAEALQGAAVGHSPVFGVILGTGVGGGVVIDGKLLRGASGLAGEWGHVPLPYFRADPVMPAALRERERKMRDRACYCGRPNCIETFLSGPGLAGMHAELHGLDASSETVGRQLDEAARDTMQLYCHMLARSLAQIVNVIDPAVIVLGGGVSNAGGIVQRTCELLERYVFSYECAARVVPARLGDSAGVIGAAWLPTASVAGA
jgi:fructokinase